MKIPVILVSIAAAAAIGGLVLRAGKDTQSQPIKAAQAQIARGQYLAHRVGVCVDCHSPRDANGFVEGRHLTGSALPFVATVPMPWAPAAPSLAGLPAGYDRDAMIHFLITGERPHGQPPPRPPMPGYRLNQEDAEALTDYLISLAPAAAAPASVASKS